ncbi:MAG: hypothetical protein MJZ19_01220 [Paludibacteraceae bacterium]|nr:hypothetical protein [Paludibacteraceae bacterium]
MAKLDGLDGLCNIQDRHIYCLTQALDFYAKNDLSNEPSLAGWSKGEILQALAYPLHKISNEYKRSFKFQIPKAKALTKSGAPASPAIATYTITMGLSFDDKDDYALTSVGEAILERRLYIPSYALILLSKVGIYDEMDCRISNILTHFCDYATKNPNDTYTPNNILSKLPEDTYINSRSDILFNAFVISGILSVNENEEFIVNSDDMPLVSFLAKNGNRITPPSAGDKNYMGDITKGITELIDSNNKSLFSPKYSDLISIKLKENSNTPTLPTPTTPLEEPLQQIFYGAPGTGKSHGIKDKESQFSEVIRTTFHPDSDYSTFVGAYKPVMDDVRKCVVIDKEEKEVKPLDGGSKFERRIAYKFIKQAFLKAYISAWKGLKENKPVLLVIEEINRGNCAQIFGDIFQLLDRDESGYSSYSIDADDDIQRELSDVFKEANIDIEEIKNGTKLLLPPNLYIWATMNTSDQSLFPIDSAFKRRWDWKYVKIKDEGKGWTIANTDKTSWWDFLKAVNRVINEMTSSADKQLGYFFCKPKKNETEISAETFVGKVIFYLWNDVFKDYGFDDTTLFRYNDSEGRSVEISFPSFYDVDGEKINKDVMDKFIQNVLNWRKDKESEQN